MRTRFPYLWLLQLAILLGIGLFELLAPMPMLEGYLGVDAPRAVEWPDPGLNRWAIHLEVIPPPPPEVVAFFDEEHEVRFPGAGVWSADDPDSRILTGSGMSRWQATMEWILSARPQAPPPHQQHVEAWMRAVDQAKTPSEELLAWVAGMREAGRPHPELLVWIGGMDQVDVHTWELAKDGVRLEAPYVLAAAIFTFFGLLNPVIRSALARIFTLIFVLWSIPVVYGHQPEVAGELLLTAVGGGHLDATEIAEAESGGGAPILQARHLLLWVGLLSAVTLGLTLVRSIGKIAGLTLYAFILLWSAGILWYAPPMPLLGDVCLFGFVALILINGYYWLVVPSESPPQDDAGIAEGRPPQLWTLWLIQFVWFFAVGLAVLLFPNAVFELFTVDSHDHLATGMVDDQLRFSGTWIFAMALFSYVALGVADDRTWRAFAWIFICSFALFAVSNVLNISSGEYSWWAYAFSFQGFVFIPLTYRLLRAAESPWDRENVERLTEFPTLPALWAVVRMTRWLTGRRSIYRHGVAASGLLTVLPEVRELPAHELFTGGARFRVHARFANRAHGDDAAADVRGASLRLYDREGRRVLELPFATGSFALVSCLGDFLKVLPSPARDGRMARSGKRLERAIRSSREIFEGFVGGLRRAPASFTTLTYHHQVTRHWITPSSEQWLCRFRLSPPERPDPSELGEADASDLETPWRQERRADEQRGTRYLREELEARLQAGERPEMRLEVQLHRLLASDSLEWYEPAVEWRVHEHAWHPLARLELRTLLTQEESDALRFDPSHSPRSLSIPRSDGAHDPRSLATSQSRVMRLVGKVRHWRRPPRQPVGMPRLDGEAEAAPLPADGRLTGGV